MKDWLQKLYKYLFETDEGKTLVFNITRTKFWEMFKDKFKRSLVKLLKLGAFSGFQAFLIDLVLEHFYDKIVEPVLKRSLRGISYTYDKIEGKVLIEKLNDAKASKNETDYNSTVDDILN